MLELFVVPGNYTNLYFNRHDYLVHEVDEDFVLMHPVGIHFAHLLSGFVDLLGLETSAISHY